MKLQRHFWTVMLPLSACGPPQPAAIELPSASDVPYRVLLKTFHDGAYADQPFHLMVSVPGSTNEPKTVLRASQCRNVSVAPTDRTLHVFYEELTLSEFVSLQYRAPEPRVRLCDLHFEECAIAERQLAMAGAKLSNVCTYRTR